jgi:hypothetical protein
MKRQLFGTAVLVPAFSVLAGCSGADRCLIVFSRFISDNNRKLSVPYHRYHRKAGSFDHLIIRPGIIF